MSLRPRTRFDLVCANLIATLLLEHRKRLIACVRPGGTLVLAGILATEFEPVKAAFEECGAKFICARTEKEWRSGGFRIP
jgi:ribosomal protein L11 methyltransferase